MTTDQQEGMSRRDREELSKLTRRREKVAKSDARERAARIRADGEAQLATIFKADDFRWAEAVKVAERQVEEANAVIDRHCDDAGIPENFRPYIGSYFSGRGDNASLRRRAELRRVLETRVAALEKEAFTEIERRSLDIQTELMAGGLDSETARTFLSSMPTADALMPGFAVQEFPEVAQLMGNIDTDVDTDG